MSRPKSCFALQKFLLLTKATSVLLLSIKVNFVRQKLILLDKSNLCWTKLTLVNKSDFYLDKMAFVHKSMGVTNGHAL